MAESDILQVDVRARVGRLQLALSFRLDEGFTALFGPSGCGKTTTLRLIAGLLRPLQGHIRLFNTTLFDSEQGICLPAFERQTGLIFQDGRLFPHLSVHDNLLFGYSKTPAHLRRFHPQQVIELLRLAPLLQRSPHTLSGGEAQRVAIGRALLASPALLLMDEPLAAVDVPVKLGLLAELKTLQQQLDLPILYVSHDLNTVLNIANSVLLMQEGTIKAAGAPLEILADFISSGLTTTDTIRNLIRVELTGHDDTLGISTARAGDTTFFLPRLRDDSGSTILLDIPASEIIIATRKPEGLSARNILPARVLEIRRLGSRVVVQADAGVVLSVEITEGVIGALQLQPGREIFLVIKATAFRRIG